MSIEHYDKFTEIGEKKHLDAHSICCEMHIDWENRDEGFQLFCDFLYKHKLLTTFRKFIRDRE